MTSNRHARRAVYCVALGLAILGTAPACSRAPEPDYFAAGEKHYLAGEYEPAIAAFKQHLLEHPEDAGGHFYLGTSYLYLVTMSGLASTKSNLLGIAQGELETALSLFERQGKVNPIPRFNATYFEMMCHLNQAKIYLFLVDALAENPRLFAGMNPHVVIPGLLQQCAEHAAAAEKVAPGNPDVESLKAIIGPVPMPPSGAAPSSPGNRDQTPRRQGEITI